MNWFKNLKIRTKLLTGFTLVAIISGVIGYFGITNIKAIDDNGTQLYENMTEPIAWMSDISTYFQRIRVNTRDIILAKTPEDVEKYASIIDSYRDSIEGYGGKFEERILSDKMKEVWSDFKQTRVVYKKDLDMLHDLAIAHRDEEAFALLHGDMRKSADAEMDAITKLVNMKIEDARLKSEINIETTDTATTTMIIVIVFGFAISIGLGLFVTKLISNPIQLVAERGEQLRSLCVTNMGKGLKALAAGDTKFVVETGTPLLKMNRKDEIGDLAQSIDGIISETLNSVALFESSRDTINEVVSETNNLTQAAKEGKLSVRGNASKFKGAYNELVAGINGTLDEITKPITESAQVLEVMSTGDLTVRVVGNYNGDHQLMKNSINGLGESLKNVITKVTDAVEATASASTQISSSAEEMAAGAQEQSSQTAEVAAAMEEMSRTVVETAANATNAATASKEVSDSATEGEEKLKASSKGMQRIVTAADTVGRNIASLTNQTEQIGEIALVIDDIADQTNLLALNAAIEAARAGEHGRGFAVVADEVRKLAEGTTKATKEIAGKIKAIQDVASEASTSMEEAGTAVNDGMVLNDEVGEVLTNILSGIENVLQQITQVAAASEEQSATAEQVSTNVEAINNVANESAAGVQQIASASEDLNRLTENLQNIVTQFVLDQQEQGYAVRENGILIAEHSG